MKKMTKEFLKFGVVKIEKIEFYCSEMAIDVNNVDVEKILVSNKFPYGKNKEKKMQIISLNIKNVKKLNH